MHPFPTPSAAVAGITFDAQHDSGPTLPPPFATEIEGSLTGTPAAAAAPMASSPIASTVTIPARACVPDSHGSASKVHRRAFASPSCTTVSLMQPTSCMLPSRQPRRLALASTIISIVSHASQRNGSDSSEDLLTTHTATPPMRSPSSGAEVLSSCNAHSCTDKGSPPSCDAANEGVEPQHRCVCTRSRVSRGALAALAESSTANPLPSAPSHVGAAVVSDAEEDFTCASNFCVPATGASLASTESPIRRARVSPSPRRPAVEPTHVPYAPLPGRDYQSSARLDCRCSMSIPSPPLGVSPFARRPSTPGRTLVTCGPSRGTEPEAAYRHRSESAPPRTVAHELLPLKCKAALSTSVVLPTAARRRSSYVSDANMQGFFSLNKDGAESSDGGATTIADTPLMLPDTSRATAFSGAAAATTWTTTNVSSHRSFSLTATQRGSSAATMMECTCSFSSNVGSSGCASAAVAEAALLPTPSESPPHRAHAPSSATTSEMQNDRGEDSTGVSTTTVALVATSAIRLVNRPLTGPVTGASREDLARLLSPFRDVDVQSNLAATPVHLHACLATECDRAMRAVLRQEVWAQQTAAGRKELQRQVAAHIFARCHNRGESLLEDAPARRWRSVAPWPEQGLLFRDTVLVSDDGNSRVRSGAAAAAVAIAWDTPPSQGLFLRLVPTSLPFMRCRRGTAMEPEGAATEAACPEAADDERTVVAVESPVGMEATVGSATVEVSEWTQPPWHLRRIDTRASIPLPHGVSQSRSSVDSSSFSLSYDAALLTAAQEMSG